MRRSLPQWTVFGVAALLLAAVVVALVAQWLVGSSGPAVLTATVTAVTQVDDGGWHAEVAVTNIGEETGENVEVVGELTLPDGAVEEAQQTVDFISPEESAMLVFVFGSDPTAGELDVRVAGYTVP